MISPEQIARARAVDIARVVGAVVELKGDFGLCPFHPDKATPSLHIHRPSNRFICFSCNARGDSIAFLRRIKKLAFAEAVAELTQGRATGHSTLPRKAPRGRPPTVPSLVLELWRGATAPNLARFYLESRGIVLKALPEAIRGHPAVWCKDAGEPRPCMLAAISGAEGRITAVHRIYLEARLAYDGDTEFKKGARAADLAKPKLTLGPMASGAVRLAAAREVLGLCEGVESALAAAALYRLPVWATCGAARLGLIELPPVVKHVVIFGDPDQAGRAAAAKAERAYRARGYGCQVEYPDAADWCEVLR